jgi:hypothetical protein
MSPVHHDRAVKEVEAESTAFVVCSALGLDTSRFSLPYVAHWATREPGTSEADEKKPESVVAATGERIRKASAVLLEALLPAEHTDDEQAAA